MFLNDKITKPTTFWPLLDFEKIGPAQWASCTSWKKILKMCTKWNFFYSNQRVLIRKNDQTLYNHFLTTFGLRTSRTCKMGQSYIMGKKFSKCGQSSEMNKHVLKQNNNQTLHNHFLTTFGLSKNRTCKKGQSYIMGKKFLKYARNEVAFIRISVFWNEKITKPTTLWPLLDLQKIGPAKWASRTSWKKIFKICTKWNCFDSNQRVLKRKNDQTFYNHFLTTFGL